MKSKNIVYEQGMKFCCGPPIRAGAYDNWNWCSVCTTIHSKDYKRCVKCNQTLRVKAKGNNKRAWLWSKQ